MGKVIPTLTNTTYITKNLPQNCPKTPKPQNPKTPCRISDKNYYNNI